MSEWITDRRPKKADGSRDQGWVFDERGYVVDYSVIMDGEPWKPIPKCEPYVKPWRISIIEEARYGGSGTEYTLMYGIGPVARHIRTREAAERIAAIYEEMLP